MPATPGQIFDKLLDQEAGEVIRGEDKMGILSIGEYTLSAFSPLHVVGGVKIALSDIMSLSR